MAVDEHELTDLATKIEETVRETLRLPTLDAVRSIANESGIRRARTLYRDAPDVLDAAKRQLRGAQMAQRSAKEAYDDALLDGEWALDDHFVTEGNKTYLVYDETRKVVEPKRAMTADERREWKAQQAKRLPAVAFARTALDLAEEATTRARDEVDLAEARMTAAKYELIAAGIELQTLAIGLQAKEQ